MTRLPFLLFMAGATTAAPVPLALNPDNPHYFSWRGKPVILLTSGEHYGAVLNRDFDYVKYLDALSKDGLNLTRTFSGVYFEPVGAFKIQNNTLGPPPDRYIGPWKKVDGGKYNLNQWDESYFARLKDFVAKAGERGVVVELNLFCPFYKQEMWMLSPMNPVNNLQKTGTDKRDNVYTLDKNGGLLAVHEKLVQKIVSELKDADNVYYEICNEPYFGGVMIDWQRRIADVIDAAEKEFPARHLISQNIANGSATVADPHPAVSIFNFHYASPPEAVGMNLALKKVIGDNETGFKGTAARPYRTEAWEFLLAGGGLYNNLDYSFTVGHEDGGFEVKEPTPGCGGPDIRHHLAVLREFITGFDFLHMKPMNGIVKGGTPKDERVQVLAETGKSYAIYVTGGGKATLKLDLPAAKYQADWVNPLTGNVDKSEVIEHAGGSASLASPDYAEDIALRIRAQ